MIPKFLLLCFFVAAINATFNIDMDSTTTDNKFNVTTISTSFTVGQILSAGDMNGDGYPDIIILVQPIVYVIFGGSSLSDFKLMDPFPSIFGFKISGFPGSDIALTISPAGDFNNDGYSDI